MLRSVSVFAFSLALVPFLNLVSRAAEFEGLLRQIPANANAMLFVDADGLRTSKLGLSQRWGEKNEAAYVKGVTFLPPEANRIVIASRINPNRNFERRWEVAVMSLTEPMSARAIARAEGGQIDEINGFPAVWSPSDAYFVLDAEDTLKVHVPADRQGVSQWIKSSNETVSSFLSDSLAVVSGEQIVLAIDLKDSVMPFQLRDRLSDSGLAQDRQFESWQSVIETIEGVQLFISVDDNIEARLVTTFGMDPGVFGKQAKAAIVKALDSCGVGLDSIDNWNVSTVENALVARGELSTADLRKVLSLLELPGSNFSTLSDAEVSTSSGSDEVISASQKYFQSISSLLDDLENEFRTNVDARRGRSTTFMQRYAKRIDNLPILNVDTDLVDFGLTVSDSLRATAVSQGSANIDAGVRTSQTNDSGNYGYYGTYRTGTEVRSQIKREENSVAMKDRFNNWKEIQNGLAEMRKNLTQRYNAVF